MLEDVLYQFPWLTTEFAGLAAWLWVALPAIFIGSWLVTRIIVAMAMGIAGKLVRHKGFFDNYMAPLGGPIALFATGLLFVAGQGLLPLEDSIAAKLSALNAVIFTFAVTWGLIRLTHNMFETAREHLVANGRAGAAAIIPLMRKMSKATIVVLALIFLLQNWGFDVAAIIAALGVGGIALALASQKSVENLFGGIMISLDQPIRVGDFGNFGDFVGTVEDIGLRSTRIRTLGRTVVSIPNSEMASMRLETFAPRDKILLKTLLGLRYETTADQMRYIIVAIKELLLSHPKVDNDPARARFVAFNDYSLDIEIFAYVKTADWSEYLEVQEDIFLRIKDIVEEAGSDFAFPSQTMYFERGSGLDAELQKSTGAKVSTARKQGSLQWPSFTSKHVQELTDTLVYPPKESAAANQA
jgi:MscS family membrane protein